jgi:exodeoxyribonuclease-3
VIRAAGADLVGLQEVEGRAATEGGPRPDRSVELARELGFHHRRLAGRNAVLSRWPIADVAPGRWGVLVETPTGTVALFDVHLHHAPYQPYQLAGIEYHGGRFIESAAEAIAEATEARGDQVTALLDAIASCGWEVPTLVVGDFNEPSCLDWTERARSADVVDVAIDWPSTRRLTQRGFVDAWRSTHPDEVAERGYTWTPLTAPDDPADRHDRIDFVFCRGTNRHHVLVAGCWIVGEAPAFADITSLPWPSDHRAVIAEVRLVPEATASR